MGQKRIIKTKQYICGVFFCFRLHRFPMNEDKNEDTQMIDNLKVGNKTIIAQYFIARDNMNPSVLTSTGCHFVNY